MQKGSWGQDWGIYIMLANDPRQKKLKFRVKEGKVKNQGLKRVYLPLSSLQRIQLQ
jgi:hypothetical protein